MKNYKYFCGVTTIEELKKQYKKLAKQYHPDLNDGTTQEEMKQINNEYDDLFNKVKNFHETADGETYEKEATETSEEFRNIINSIIKFNIDIEIIGTWVWCFNSYEYRTQLKELGFRYSANKKAWCWHSGEYKPRKSKKTLAEIRNKYGSETIKQKEDQIKLAYA